MPGEAFITPGVQPVSISSPCALVLGTAQDGGHPQAGCKASCCNSPGALEAAPLYPSSLAVCDPASRQNWIIDCTPAFPQQLALLEKSIPLNAIPGFLLTHAHIGHYTGLIQLGREVLNAAGAEVYVLEGMKAFLESNLPWKELVTEKNIELRSARPGQAIDLSPAIRVTPYLVPHRDEYSETACFRVDGPTRSLLWLPDVDVWEDMTPAIEDLISDVDIAFLDGTFFNAEELPGRDLRSIAHPFIEDSIRRFSALPAVEREKIRFIHLNHSNPAIQPTSAAARKIEQAGHSIASQGDLIEL